MQFRLRGREFIIEKRLPDGRIRIKDIITDERSALPEQDLVRRFLRITRSYLDSIVIKTYCSDV